MTATTARRPAGLIIVAGVVFLTGVGNPAAAQRNVPLQILPPVFTADSGAAAHFRADLPAKLLVSLNQQNSGVAPCLVGQERLRSLGIDDSGRLIDVIASRSGLNMGGMCAADSTDAYTLAIELTSTPSGRPGVSQVFARFVAFSAARGIALDDTAEVQSNEEDRLANLIADRVIVRLTKDIRIAVTDFRMTSSDSSGFENFGQALPRILSTRLASSRPARLMLLEYSTIDSAFRSGLSDSRTPGVTDPLTVVRRGRELLANYVILGDYMVLEGTLRIDVRCVSVESRAVIASLGVSITPITIRSIDESFADLAANLRGRIEEDFSAREQRPRYVAIAGVVPLPATGENRGITRELVRTAARKVAQVTGGRIRVREQLDDVRLYSGSEPRWNLASDLNADIVIRLRMDRTMRDRPHIEAEYFDIETPSGTRPLTKSVPMESLGVALDTVVATLFSLYEPGTLTDSVMDRVTAVRFAGVEQPSWFDVSVGIAGHNDGTLFLEAGGGAIVRLAPTVILHGWQHVMWEPLGLRFDLFGMKGGGRQTVVGLDAFTSGAVRFRRYRSLSPFVGPSMGILGVVRFGSGDIQFDGQFGLGLIAGMEHTLASGRRIRYRFEYTRSVTPVHSKTVGDEFYPGGRAGGIYLTVGTSRGF